MNDEEKNHEFFNKIQSTWKGRGKKNERFGRGHQGPTFKEEKVEELTTAQKKLPSTSKSNREKRKKNK